MTRRLLSVLSALSLVLCLASVVLWAMTAFKPLVLSWGDAQAATGYVLAVRGGLIEFQRHWGVKPLPLGVMSYTGGDVSGLNQLGLFYTRSATIYKDVNANYAILPGRYGNHIQFGFALFWPILLGLPLSVRAAWRLVTGATRRDRRTRLGLCPSCAYDLRATPDRCPECGAAVARSAAAKPPGA